MGTFKMPSLGADMEAGTVTRWLVKPGDQVQRGDVIAVVDTEKSTIEIEVFESGTVEALMVGEGQEVAVGTPLATIAPLGLAPAHDEPAAIPAPAAEIAGPAAAVPRYVALPAQEKPLEFSPVVRHLADELAVDLASVGGTGPGGRITRADVEGAARPESAAVRAISTEEPTPRVRSSPFARKLASAAGIDLETVTGTGPGSVVVSADVSRVVSGGGTRSPDGPAQQPAPSPTKVDRQEAMRHAIGMLMARSKREIPHYYLSTTIDLGSATSWLERTNLDRSVADRLVMPVLFIKAVARAAAVVPEMNGFMVGDSFEPSAAVHVGVAISLRHGGVIAPAIHDVTELAPDQLMAALRDLVTRARAGSLRSSEMSDPTITVTNLGDLGVEAVFGVIYPPQVALVGFGRVLERPWAENGMLGVRPCVTATLSADHRASDGHRGGRFLAEIQRLMQHPEEL